MEEERPKVDIEAVFNQLVAKESGVSIAEPSEAEQARFLGGFSLGALVYSTVYFWAMNDSLLVWVSLIGAIFFFPILFFLPFIARKRAWKSHQWASFSEFERAQQRWDRNGWYGIILTVVVLFLIYQFVFMPLVRSILPAGSDSTTQIEQLKSELQDLQGL